METSNKTEEKFCREGPLKLLIKHISLHFFSNVRILAVRNFEESHSILSEYKSPLRFQECQITASKFHDKKVTTSNFCRILT